MNTITDPSTPSTLQLRRLAIQLGFGLFLAKGCVWLLLAAFVAERL
jgi:hypothetical protein